MEGTRSSRSRPERGYMAILSSFLMGALLLLTGFLAGWYWQQTTLKDLVTVEIVPRSEASAELSSNAAQEEKEAESTFPEEIETDTGAPCLFVGSRNSDKYHDPLSAPAKRIKEENKVCFSSEEEALEEGYTAGTL